ncbi:hypothetical protein [Tenacibaculum aquimarinum]|uniref:hypothetical protein n=1 Tax=Tenacibaculum aquimarinum TaxID=2910675 RepID=UPI001F0AE803|nr:hypothetical protein [Tenacibaculum aquimarinum]MCH3883462.1 hypothetical protein [Tenacibaculum aquimarinum]
MKKIITLTFLLASTLSISQILENAPWTTNNVNTQRNSNPTLEEVSTAAEAYFRTIDVEKKVVDINLLKDGNTIGLET